MDDLSMLDIDKDLDKMYEMMNDKALDKQRKNNNKLNKLRNENHKRFYKINMVKLNNLPNTFDDIVLNIFEKYKLLASKKLLTEELNDAENSKTELDIIYKNLNRLEKMIEATVKELEEENDKIQSSFSIVDLKNLNVDEERKNHILNLYNEIILFNSTVEEDLYDALRHELLRKEYLSQIVIAINLGNTDKLNYEKKEKTGELNAELNKIIDDTSDKIQYLSDLMMEGSDYTESFNDFLEFYNKIIAYDDMDYDNVKQTYDIFKDKDKLGSYIKKFENDFIDEREKSLRDEQFILEHIGLKNIKQSLYYITACYISDLKKCDKRVVKDCYDRLTKNDINVSLIGNNLKYIVNDIWKKSITDISKHDNSNFCYLCSNTQFMEPKSETILLTNTIVNRMDNFLDYQIGFICNYEDNILYITENDDIMSVENEDMSYLKTPKQIEKEFCSFDVLNRIALNGYKTKAIGVYYIDDGDESKHRIAETLSSNASLPLVIIKKK